MTRRVLRELLQDLRWLTLHVSIVARLCPALCCCYDAVVGNSGGTEIREHRSLGLTQIVFDAVLLHPGMAELYRQKVIASPKRSSVPTRAWKLPKPSAALSTPSC